MSTNIERILEEGLQGLRAPSTAVQLREAIRYAVFPTGACVRPRLCLEVARACCASTSAYRSSPYAALAEAAAGAVEFVHCASLVHDDLPCFDDAAFRRGRPSVHRAYGETIAVLVGDALIVNAFGFLARKGSRAPERLGPLIVTLSDGVGARAGIICGQAWESEPGASPEVVRRLKTGALFAAAATLGAQAMGAEGAGFRRLGMIFGEAYQVADDLVDARASARAVGKPVLRDASLGRPCAVRPREWASAVSAFRRLKQEALERVPACPGRERLRGWTAAAFDSVQRRFEAGAPRPQPAGLYMSLKTGGM